MGNRDFDLRYNISYEPDRIAPVSGVKPPTRLKALLIYLIVAGGLLAASVVTSVIQMIWPDIGMWGMQTISTFLYYPLACVLPVLIATFSRGKDACKSLRPNPLRFPTAMLALGLAVLAVFFANSLGTLWALPFDAIGWNVYAGSVEAPRTIGQLLLSILVVGVMPGICEELVFRGFIMPAFEEKGSKRAVIVVALLFALLHGSVIGFPAQFTLGLILAALVLITDSIYAGAIFHTAYNSLLMLLSYIQGQMGVEESAVGQLWSDMGGVVGVISVVISVMQLAAGIFFILFAMYRRAKRKNLRIVEKQPMRLRGGEIALLCAGLSLALFYYLSDVLVMAGVLV